MKVADVVGVVTVSLDVQTGNYSAWNESHGHVFEGSEAQAALVADAFNTYTKTGLTPSQLVTSREELVGRGYGDDAYISILESAVKTLRAALSNLTADEDQLRRTQHYPDDAEMRFYVLAGEMRAAAAALEATKAVGSLGSIRDQVDAVLEATKAVRR